jgi:excisionase family DNA binding protein
MTTVELAKILGISEQTLRQWRINGKGPPYIKIGQRIIRYDKNEVEAWIERVNPTPPPETVKTNKYDRPKMPRVKMSRTRFNLEDGD